MKERATPLAEKWAARVTRLVDQRVTTPSSPIGR
jgi:hypothetical protein